MKFVCERCHTKYSIADDKVRQKILKIRCKTCENVITIRDAVVVSDGAGPRAEPPPTPSQASRPQSSVEWHIAINGRQEGPLGLSALCTRVQTVRRDDEVYVWNEHLDGWKEPKQIPEIAAELKARAALSSTQPPPLKRAPTLPGARAVGLPPPGGTGRSSGGLPAVAASPRASASHKAVSLSGAAAARLVSAVPSGAAFDEGAEEKTQISAMDASVLYPEQGGGAARQSGSQQAVPDQSLASLLDLSISRPLPQAPDKAKDKAKEPNGSKRPTSGGLASLDFVPVPVAASKRATGAMPAVTSAPAAAAVPAGAANAGVVAGPVVGGSTSMLLSQIGGRAARVRHPAIKYVVTGSILVGLVIVISVVTMSGGDKTDANARPVAAASGEGQPANDPEAVARAEAEKYFKSMVGESKPTTTSKSVHPPASRRSGPPPRPRNNDNKPPALAPPPLGSQLPPTSTGVARRLGPGERQVAPVYRNDSQSRGGASFDMGKVMGVVKQQDHTNAIKSCYERALKRDDRLRQGRLEIEVTVGEMGSVKRVKIDPPTDFGGASGCIRDSVRRWRFPATGAEYTFSFPFIFAGTSE